MRKPLQTCIGAVFAFLLTAGVSHAGSIQWSYDWAGSTSIIKSDPFGPNSLGTGSIFLTPSSGNAANTVGISAVNLTTISAASSDIGSPDRYTNSPYTLKVDLTDSASHSSHVFTFSGVFNGTVTQTIVKLSTMFNSPTTQSFLIGGNKYSVTIGPFSAPDAPGDPGDGSGFIHANVAVTAGGGDGNGGNGGGIHNTPEPSSLFLAGMGLAGMLGWSRKRRQVPATVGKA